MLGELFQKILRALSRLSGRKQSQPQSSSSASQQDSSVSGEFMTKLIRQLRRDEGVINRIYRDSLGYETIGVGHLVDPRKGGYLPDYAQSELDVLGYLTDQTIDRLLIEDIEIKRSELDRRIDWAKDLDEARYGALLNMSFQLGVNGLLGFKNTLAMIQAGDYEAASRGMLNSLWARQTPNRARRVAEQMRTGEWV